MKYKYLYILGLLALCGCARTVSTNKNEIDKEVLEAWLGIHYPGVTATGCGIYILEDEPAVGEAVSTDGYVILDYTTTDDDGAVYETTDELTARKVDLYSASNYYGPVVQSTASSALPAGVEEMLSGMTVGSRRKALIPAWLMTTTRYSTPEEYIKQSTDTYSRIYNVTVRDFTEDITQYQIDLLEAMSMALYSSADSLKYGFYYHRTAAPASVDAFPSDTTVYFNYTGKLLNGKVFDTSISDVAKDAGIYSASKTYGPASATWGEDYSDIKVTFAGSSSAATVTTGFQLTLWQMHSLESGTGMFYSGLGYTSEGSGSSIPAYAPLIFEIQMVRN